LIRPQFCAFRWKGKQPASLIGYLSFWPEARIRVSLEVVAEYSVRRIGSQTLMMRPSSRQPKTLLLLLAMSAAAIAHGQEPTRTKPAASGRALIWEDPGTIATRNLFYGSGGETDQPRLPVTFLKEDTKGSNPKFDVRDQNGEKWKVKLGVEARPETVATRLLWAVGYFTEEDYLVPDLKAENMPALVRGQEFVHKGGETSNARLKRHPEHAESDGEWHWRKNPFLGSREFNGLRVMMALMNNWDLKDENNSIYRDKKDGSDFYLVADLGASFGSTGYRFGPGRGKGDLGAYKHSKFVSHIHKHSVDFSTPSHSPVIQILGIFSIREFVSRFRLRWIGRNIPRQDAKWIGGLLAQLTPEQIRDAFRAANYSQQDIETYSAVVQQRIADLGKL
jgi:hypothetical protein